METRERLLSQQVVQDHSWGGVVGPVVKGRDGIINETVESLAERLPSLLIQGSWRGQTRTQILQNSVDSVITSSQSFRVGLRKGLLKIKCAYPRAWRGLDKWWDR